MKTKKAQTGESILMIMRLVLLMIIAFSIYFISSLYLTYHIDTKNIDATLLGKNIFECVAPNSEVALSNLPEAEKILEHCGIKGADKSYILINITQIGKEPIAIEENTQYKESAYIYNMPGTDTKATQKYKPGQFKSTRDIIILDGEEKSKAVIKIEIIMENEI